MPKLRKPYAQDQTEDSLTFAKYLAVQEMQTSIPQLINQDKQKQSSLQRSQKNKATSNKKSKRSLKKQKKNDSQEILQTQKTEKRKSRKKKVEQSLQKTEDQDQKSKQRIQSPKPQKKQKSQRKNKKSSKKPKTEQNQYHSINKNKDEFNGNQLRQKQLQNNETQDNKIVQKEEQKTPVNFNKRLRKKNQTEEQDLNVLLSRYAEDESSNPLGNRITSDDDSSADIGYKFQSDLRDLDLLVKKKEKKQKKEKQIKINNKYFSDILMSESYDPQDPPQNSEELIIEKKQPRKTIHNLNQVIEKRVNHIKDRREFKNSDGDIRVKNQLKNKLQEVKDVQQVQVDIEIPHLFTKKTASAALYMKNAFQAEEKKTTFSQKNTHNERKLQKTSSSSSLTDNKNEQALSAQHKKNQEFMFQMKKKGVKREDFFDHLNKQIKSKKHTEIGSQQIKDCFKTSNLNEQNFDVELADEALSNCSSRSHSQQSSKNTEMNGNVGQNSNSKSFITNRSSKHLPSLINPPISQVKQSDASNSVSQIEKSSIFGIKKNVMRFDVQQIKEEVQKSFQNTLKIFQSQNQFQIEKKNYDEKTMKKDSEIKTINKMLQNQKESDKKLEKKLQKIIKNTKQKKSLKSQDCIGDMLGDNLNEENSQKHEKKRKKKEKRNKHKKTKQGLQSYDYESYFEVEAEYSSDEQGHSDSQDEQLDSDLDEEGNILGFIDKDTDGLQLNEKKVKRKFLQDQEKKDHKIIEKIMKGLYGRKKLEQTDSEKRLRKRMEQAAKKNLLDDLQEINGKDKQFQQSELCQNPQEKIPQTQNQNEENSRQMRKLKEMEQLLLSRGHRNAHNENFSRKDPFVNEAWKIINPSLPVRKTIIPSNMNEKRVSVDKNKEHRKSIFDTKKGAVQQEIFNKTIQADRPRADSTGNRNKLQKTSQIRLEFRNTNVKLDQDIQI